MSYVLGMIILPLGAALMAKADLGISMVVAPAYLLHLRFAGFLTFGMAEFILQTLLLVAMCIIVRKVKLGYVASFGSAIIYGVILDGWVALLNLAPVPSLPMQIFYYVVGMVVSSIGVAFFFHTYLPPCAYDYFVREVAEIFKLNITRFKLSYDITSCVVAAAMSLLFFSALRGVGIGTVICAFINGFIISFFSRLFEKFIDFSPRFRLERFFN